LGFFIVTWRKPRSFFEATQKGTGKRKEQPPSLSHCLERLACDE
jgi:hypothetical protein